jgi:hypothetical protein
LLPAIEEQIALFSGLDILCLNQRTNFKRIVLPLVGQVAPFDVVH